MPADPPRPARDEVVERLEEAARNPDGDTSSLLTGETHDYSCVHCDDLRTILARLAQAERRAEEAERLAGERLQANLRLSDALRRFQAGERASAIHVQEVIERHCGNHTAAHHAANALKKVFTFTRRAAALADDAQGGRDG